MWYHLHHDHIVPCYGASITANPPFIMLRYMQYGHLLQYLQLNANADRVKLIYEVTLGMRYLHEEEIVHGDIKATNILVDDASKACLTDFGLSSAAEVTPSGTDPRIVTGTLRFMAPEAIETGCLTYATDVYAFGMVIYEVFTEEPPFLADKDADVMAGRLTLKRPFSQSLIDRGLSDAMWGLLVDCSSRNSSNRPSSREVSLRAATLSDRTTDLLNSPNVPPYLKGPLHAADTASKSATQKQSQFWESVAVPQDVAPSVHWYILTFRRVAISSTEKGCPVYRNGESQVPLVPENARDISSTSATSFTGTIVSNGYAHR
ncbi:kinase-like protein, partial [Obba rivulosa]